ncbi:hypothetical protein [Rhizobium leguminosarum]|uniref:hypothetical protein n=1 Tax=Rhizobium leguminosarum TaxID=384 RepID=UPI002E0D60AA|nr:hypothetical protein U8Q02_36550 [Rhizobium leguminosarum]
MGFYVLSELGMTPMFMSGYAAISIPISILTTTIFGRLIDRSVHGGALLTLSSLAYMCGCLSLMVRPEYSTVLLAGVAWFPVASAATSTTFALAFHNVAQGSDDRLSTGSRLKAANSIGWMIGPAAAFGIHGMFGSPVVFATLFGAGVVWGVLILTTVVLRGTARIQTPTARPAVRRPSPAIVTGLLVCGLFSAAHSLCSVALPLYVTQELALPSYAPGAAFTVKVFAELVVITLTPGVIRTFGVEAALFASGTASIAAFAIFLTAGSVPAVLAGAVVEGCYYGLFSATSLSYMQGLSDSRHGTNTARYMNSVVIGSLVASPTVGLVAQWSNFGVAIALAAAVMTGALIILAFASRSHRQRMQLDG